MNYLRSFLQEKKRPEKRLPPTDKTDKTPSGSFVSDPKARFSTCFSPNRTPETAGAVNGASLPNENRDAHLRAQAQEDLRPAWTRTITPNSRRPLMPPEVRQKIEAIEADARRMGWPPELLWNSAFWDCPRGLATVLHADDEIAEVGVEYITILRTKRDLVRFARSNA